MTCRYCQDGPDLTDEEMDFHDSLHLTCERRFNEEAEYWRVYHGFPKHPLVRSEEARDIDNLLDNMTPAEVRRLKR